MQQDAAPACEAASADPAGADPIGRVEAIGDLVAVIEPIAVGVGVIDIRSGLILGEVGQTIAVGILGGIGGIVGIKAIGGL